MPNDVEGSVLDAGNPEDAGTSPASWNEGYDDLVTAKGWNGPSDVLESYVNLEKAVGADKVVLPTADTDLREWEGWSKLGTPDEASAYELNAPEGSENYDQGLSDWFREVAYENKMPASMAQAMHDKFVERMGQGQADQSELIDQQNEQWHNELQSKFGTAFDERVAAANSAVREFGGEELRDVLNQANLGMNPVIINALSKIGIAKEQIATIRSNPGLMDASHPEHKVLNQKLTRLTELAYGTELAS